MIRFRTTVYGQLYGIGQAVLLIAGWSAIFFKL